MLRLLVAIEAIIKDSIPMEPMTRIAAAIRVSIIVMPESRLSLRLSRFAMSPISLLIGSYPIQDEPFQNQRRIRPAGEVEIAAQPPEPPIRLSLKYSTNETFVVHDPAETYWQGIPRELNDGSVVRGAVVTPNVELSSAVGAPVPLGDI